MTIHRSLREKQRQEREDLILQVAEEVLLEKGYHETSMEEIANRVGIAKGTLYLHFAKKEDLIYALLERELQNILHMIESVSKTEGSVQSKLALLLERSSYKEYSEKRARLFAAIHTGTDFKSVMKDRMGHILQPIMKSIETLLDEGKANREFDATLPTSVMLHTFFCMLTPIGAQRLKLGGGDLSPEERMRYALRIYLRGIGAKMSPEQ